ncbi:MAG: aspartate aminotransferase family protein [Candidatus Helarchaeota archaeon]|nr:aspartate aminotransferase family protein [Candidatus Helarchaeota archaeon]
MMSIIELENKYIPSIFPKRPVVIVKGKGALVWDVNGKEYIDCVGGNGVCLIGHSHPKLLNTIKKQAEQLITCPYIFYNDQRAKLLEKLALATPKPLEKTFLSNSGAEAIECAIKLARKYTGKKEIIAMKRGFHGRTLGALSATWNPKYRKPFEPLVPGFTHVPFGDLDAVKNAITNETAAIITEAVQGEGGVIPAPDGFLSGLRELCDNNNVLLIIDEVQTGLGRTGEFLASNRWNVVPDILCLAKGIAGGIPLGATMSSTEIFGGLKSGEHYSTFGGNPLACAAANATLDIIKDEKLVENSKKLGEYFFKKLQEDVKSLRLVREIRGMGLMLAVDLRLKHKEFILKALEKGLLLLTSGSTIIRMLPPLNITQQQIDNIMTILQEILTQ